MQEEGDGGNDYNGGRESPIFKPSDNDKIPRELIPNGPIEGTGQYKIHRLRISRSTTCTVSNVVSPSCVWLKQINHITDRLQVTDLKTLEQLKVASINGYVMAPLKEGVYARARILQKVSVITDKNSKEANEYARVLFIDEGKMAWVSVKCLAKMDEILSYHPWQALAVAIFRIRPRRDNEWSTRSVEILREILAKYEYVRIKVIQNSEDSYYNFHSTNKVDMSGLNDLNDRIEYSIVHDLIRQSNDVVYDRSLFDSLKQKIYLYQNHRQLETAFSIPPNGWQLEFPTIPKTETEFDNERDMWNEAGIGPQIPIVDVDMLEKEGYFVRGEMMVNIEGSHTVSPYEFYARPIRVNNNLESAKSDDESMPSNGSDIAVEDDAMITANEELQKYAEELNTFYGHPNNRKFIDIARVKDCLETGKRVYAIAEVDSDLAVFTGIWQRVEIIGYKKAAIKDDYYCRIRFVDSGGTEIRILSTLFEIHAMHCDRPPMCLQMCIYGVKPTNDQSQWSSNVIKFFRKELREDVPVVVNVVGRYKNNDGAVLSYNHPPHLLPNVIFVNFIQVRDSVEECLDRRLVKESGAYTADDAPVPLQCLQ